MMVFSLLFFAIIRMSEVIEPSLDDQLLWLSKLNRKTDYHEMESRQSKRKSERMKEVDW